MMNSELLAPNPCLVAIVLVVKFQDEPRVVFHYPPRPGQDNSHFKAYLNKNLAGGASSDSSEDDNTSSSEDDVTAGHTTLDSVTGISTPEIEVDETGSASPEKPGPVRPDHHKPKWNDLFGFPSGALAKLLSPGRAARKKRFETSLNDHVYLGWPVYAREDGTWRKPRRKARGKRSRKPSDDQSSPYGGRGSEGESTVSGHIAEEPEDSSAQSTGVAASSEGQSDETDVTASENGTVKKALPNAKKPSVLLAEGDSRHSKKSRLDMFHVVFVLDPPPLEYHVRVKEMYIHIVKKFSRALRWEQRRSDYMLQEASTLSSMTKHLKHPGGKNISFLKNLCGSRLSDSRREATPSTPLSPTLISVQPS